MRSAITVLSVKKTKIVDADRCVLFLECDVNREKVALVHVDHFKHLGSRIDGNGECSYKYRRMASAPAQMEKKPQNSENFGKETTNKQN